MGSHLFGNSMSLGLSQVVSTQTSNMLTLGSTVADFGQSAMLPQLPNSSSSFFLSDPNQSLNQVFDNYDQQNGLVANKPNILGLMQLPDLDHTTKISPNLFNLGFFSGPADGPRNIEIGDNGNNQTNISSSSGFMINPDHHQFDTRGGTHDDIFLNRHQEIGGQMPPHMSATALLQKAAQMDSTTSNHNATTLLKCFTTAVGDPRGSDPIVQSEIETDHRLHGLMNSFSGGGSARMFPGYGGIDNRNVSFRTVNEAGKFDNNPQSFGLSIGSSNKTTLDFLGVGYTQQEQQQQTGHIEISSLETKTDLSTQSTRVLGGSSHVRGN